MNRNTAMNAGQIIGTMDSQQVVGLDIAKQVLQLHTLDMDTGEIISQDIQAIEKRLALQLKEDVNMRRIAQIPGVGLLTVTAAIVTMGQANAFKSGREFCAWLGLVPSQTGSVGKVRLGAISKRGDTSMRTLLIHGARSVLMHAKEPGMWLEGLKSRRPANVVIVAQAAKMARTIWAVTARQRDYQRETRIKSALPCAVV